MRDPRVYMNGVLNASGYPLRDTMWTALNGAFIDSTDSRHAWALMYKRDRTYRNTGATRLPVTDPAVIATDDPFAQLIVLCLQIRNRTNYDMRYLYPTAPGIVCEIQPRLVDVVITD